MPLWIEVFSERLERTTDPLFIIERVTAKADGTEQFISVRADGANASINGLQLRVAAAAVPEPSTFSHHGARYARHGNIRFGAKAQGSLPEKQLEIMTAAKIGGAFPTRGRGRSIVSDRPCRVRWRLW